MLTIYLAGGGLPIYLSILATFVTVQTEYISKAFIKVLKKPLSSETSAGWWTFQSIYKFTLSPIDFFH